MRSRSSIAAGALFTLVAGAALVGLATPAAAAGTSYTWIGGSNPPPDQGDNHSWTDANNWSPTGVPGDGDSVTIAPPNPEHCGAHVDAIPAVTLTDLTLADSGNTAAHTQCYASLAGSAVTVTGTLTWDGGTISTPLTLPAGSTASVTSTHATLSVINADVELGGTMTLHGATGDNALQIIDPYVLHVKSSGRLVSNGSNDVSYSACCVTPAKIVNDGTVKVDNGTLDVEAVEVDQNGALVTAHGGRLLTNSAPVTTSDGATYSGNGSWSVQSRGGGTNRFAGTQTLGPDFHLVLGGISPDFGADLGGTFTLGGSGTFDWKGGTIEAGLTIGHHVTMLVRNSVTGNARRVLAGEDFAGKTVHLINHGMIVVSNGGGFDTFRARFINASDGTIRLAPGTHLTSDECCVVPDRLVNDHGNVVVPGTSSHAPVVFTNLGYYATGGNTAIGSSETLDIVGDAPSRLDGTTISGTGRLRLADPVGFAHTVKVPSGRLAVRAGAEVHGTATVSGSGSTTWTGGSLAGHLTIATSGGVSVSGKDAKYLANTGSDLNKPSTITLAAPARFASGTAKVHDLVDLGQSTLALARHSSVGNRVEFYNGTLRNTGTLVLDPGRTGSIYRTNVSPTINSGSAVLRRGTFSTNSSVLQQHGSFEIASGAVLRENYSGYPVKVTGGTLRGTGTIVGAVTNPGGTVAPAGSGTGTLHVRGTYTQGRGGTLALDVSAHHHDALSVTGVVKLLGRLVAHDLGSYRPAIGTSATVVSAGAPVTGSLNCVTSTGSATSGSNARHWTVSKPGDRVVLHSRKGRPAHC